MTFDLTPFALPTNTVLQGFFHHVFFAGPVEFCWCAVNGSYYFTAFAAIFSHCLVGQDDCFRTKFCLDLGERRSRIGGLERLHSHSVILQFHGCS